MNAFRNGKVHVCAAMCPTCIFRPGNLMDLEPGRVREMVDGAKKQDSAIIGDKYLDSSTEGCHYGPSTEASWL